MITLNQPCGLVCQGLLSDMTEKDDDFRFYCGSANQILESKESVKGAIVDFFFSFFACTDNPEDQNNNENNGLSRGFSKSILKPLKTPLEN